MNSSIVNIKQNAGESLIKTVIQGSDILEESLAQKIDSQLSTASTCSTSRPSANNEDADTDSNKTEVNSSEIVRPTKTNGSNKNTTGTDETYLLPQEMKNDSEFISIIVSKISQIIMSNGTFKQIICNAVTLEEKEKITELEKEIQHSKTKVETLESAMENQAQYSRRNCLIIHGEAVKSDGNEDTDQTAIKILSEKLGSNMTKSNLDRSHRLRPLTGNRPSPIIVKFLSYNLRNQVFQNRKKT